MIQAHIRKIQGNPRFANSVIMFAPENNLGLEASRLAAFLKTRARDIRNIELYREENGTQVGYKNTDVTKELSVALLYRHFRSGAACVDPDFCTSSGTQEDIKRMAEGHLSRMKVIKKTSAHGNDVVIVSGKYGEDGKICKGNKDDIAVTLMGNVMIYERLSNTRSHHYTQR